MSPRTRNHISLNRRWTPPWGAALPFVLAACAGQEAAELARTDRALTQDDAGAPSEGSQVAPNEYGACCAGALCAEGGSLDCVGHGQFVARAGCADDDGDGVADACRESCAQELATCSLDGDHLRVVVAGQTLDLHGEFVSAPQGDTDRYVVERGRVVIDTPEGPLALPSVAGLVVTCAPFFALSGELAGLPELGGVGSFGGIGVESEAPHVALGLARGDQLGALKLPLDGCRPYLYLDMSDRVTLSMGDPPVRTPGEALKLALDPWDPAFVFEFESNLLATKTGVPISRVGLGLSARGKLTFRSAVELPVGAGSAARETAELSAHVYGRGRVSLIPIKTPVQIELDGSTFYDLGPNVEAAPALARTLVIDGDLEELGEQLRQAASSIDAQQLVEETSVGANINALSLHYDVFEVKVGKGSMLRKDGTLRFSGEAQSAGKALTADPDSSIGKSLAAVTVQNAQRISGFIDERGGDRYRFELEGALKVGPFALEHARLVVDSERGVRVDAGVDVDVLGFVRDLERVLQCDYSGSEARCSVAGFRVASLRTALDARGPQVFLRLDMFGFYDGEFSAALGPDGRFAFAAESDRLPGSGPPPLTASSARLELRSDGVYVRARYAAFDLGGEVTGLVRADLAGGRALFSLTGSGQKAFVPGAPPLLASLTVANVDAAGRAIDVRASARVTLDPSLLTRLIRLNDGRPFAELVGDLRVDGGTVKYGLVGQADLTVADFPILAASLRLSNETGRDRLLLDAPLKLPAGLLDTRLKGEIERERFLLVSSADARVPMVGGYALTGTARLDPRGLAVDGEVRFGAGVARGSVLFDSSFRARFTGAVAGGLSIPPQLALDGQVAVDGTFGPPEPNPYLRLVASGGVRVGEVRLTAAGASGMVYVRGDGLTVSGVLQTPLSRIDMTGSVRGDQLDLRGRASFDVPIVSDVTAVTSEVISGTRDGWSCTRTGASCGFDYVGKWVDSIDDCFDSFRMKCKKKVLGQCVLYLPYCRVRVPKGNCNECSFRQDYSGVSLGSARGELALSIQSSPPALSGSARVTGTFCRGNQCQSTPVLSTSVNAGGSEVCVRLPGASLAEKAQAALGIPAQVRVSAPDRSMCGPF